MSICIDSLPNLDIKINHKNWQIALSQAFALLVSASPGEVLCITGPSRAGKSMLIDELRSLLCGAHDFEKTGLLPTISVVASNTGPHGTFSTKSFIQRMLEKVKHPTLSFSASDVDESSIAHKLERSTESVLRLALERALLLRKTRYLFIDEAQHAKYVNKSTMAAHAVLDSWKCLAESTGVVLIIVGAYPILDILRNSPHLLGRKHQVHLPRYQMTGPDIEAFMLILRHFDKVVSVSSELKSLAHCAEYLYKGSFGCIGLLKSWLKMASAIACSENTSINQTILNRSLRPDVERREIALEISEGENLLSSIELELPELNSITESAKKVVAAKRSKPYKRKPKRLKKGNRLS